MIWILCGLLVLLGCFSVVLFFGAPYLPTLKPQIHRAFELADLRPGQTLIELGCGDGKVLIAAAQIGVYSVGYELNPLLALIAWLRTRRYRKYVRVIYGNFWAKEWPPADVAFTFLLDRFMLRLDNVLSDYTHRPIKLVSFAFKIPHKSPEHIRDGVYLYRYE